MCYTHHMFWLIGCTDSKGEPDSVLKCYNDKVWSIKCLADSPYCEQLMAWFVIWDFRVVPCNVIKELIALFLLQKNTEICILVVHVSLTAADFGADSLSEWDALGELVSEALSHIVINVIWAQQLFKGLGGVSQVLSQNMAHPSTLPHPLTQMRQLTGLCLDQRVKLTEGRMMKVAFMHQNYLQWIYITDYIINWII